MLIREHDEIFNTLRDCLKEGIAGKEPTDMRTEDWSLVLFVEPNSRKVTVFCYGVEFFYLKYWDDNTQWDEAKLYEGESFKISSFYSTILDMYVEERDRRRLRVIGRKELY